MARPSRTVWLAIGIPIAAFVVVFGVSLLAFSLDHEQTARAPKSKAKPAHRMPRATGEALLLTSIENQGTGFVTATLALVPLDGAGSEPVTTPPEGRAAYDASPALSPDDTTVAFWRVREPRRRGQASARIYLVGVDGSGLHPLTRGPAVEIAPSWSGDGTRLVFSRMVGKPKHKHFALFVANADGSGVMQITKPPSGVDDVDPSWAPDGDRIVFTRARDDHGDLWITKPDRSPVSEPLLEGAHDDSTSEWSPDGQHIAFVRDGHIAVAGGHGEDVQVVTDDPEVKDWRPRWSEDGTRIVFSRDPGLIFVVDPDGSHLAEVAIKEHAAGATWGPES